MLKFSLEGFQNFHVKVNPFAGKNTDDFLVNDVADVSEPVEKEAVELKTEPVAASSKPWKKLPLMSRIGRYGLDDCKKVEKIYFLKTSKTGSTTMANILMRFGFRRAGTNFLLGETPNGALFFINGYMPFNEDICYLGRDIKPSPVFDIRLGSKLISLFCLISFILEPVKVMFICGTTKLLLTISCILKLEK